jgi:hypothetical protein
MTLYTRLKTALLNTPLKTLCPQFRGEIAGKAYF